MKAIVLKDFKQPLTWEEVPTPEPQAHEVLIHLQSSSLNHHDLWTLDELDPDLTYPAVLGCDGAGKVVALGSAVDAPLLGKQVLINPSMQWGANPRVQGDQFHILGPPQQGTFAEFICVPAQYVQAVPAHLSPAEAAALPLAGLTAYRALFTRANLQQGENVLITGVGGGASLMALSWAVAFGAQVFVTSGSDEKIKKAMALGAVGGANYKSANWETQLRQQAGSFAVIVDSAAGKGFSKLLDLAAPGGRITLFGRTAGRQMEVDAKQIFWKQLSILGTTMGTPAEFARMLQWVEQHHMKPVVDQIFKIREAEAAFDYMRQGKNFGKIVLQHT